ncbi:hypothetical protein BaRGS_00011363, partial [Batillaria attramentaria]
SRKSSIFYLYGLLTECLQIGPREARQSLATLRIKSPIEERGFLRLNHFVHKGQPSPPPPSSRMSKVYLLAAVSHPAWSGHSRDMLTGQSVSSNFNLPIRQAGNCDLEWLSLWGNVSLSNVEGLGCADQKRPDHMMCGRRIGGQGQELLVKGDNHPHLSRAINGQKYLQPVTSSIRRAAKVEVINPASTQGNSYYGGPQYVPRAVCVVGERLKRGLNSTGIPGIPPMILPHNGAVLAAAERSTRRRLNKTVHLSHGVRPIVPLERCLTDQARGTDATPYYNECVEGSHDCHADADCINLEGTYKCRCHKGYGGDGFTCKPVCHGDCLNGGKCIGPNTCQCRHGYIGPNCELDIDECALGISACRGNSVCINEPGWYHCDCLQGFHSIWPDNHYGNVNECVGEGEGHTCHPSTECVNTEGGYNCRCASRDKCLHNCIFQGAEHKNGSTWLSAVDKCMTCTCQSGVATCHRMTCDCDADDVDLECCPRCDVSSSCPHQEFSLTMEHGETWVYQCQICECLHGEIDCWPLDCPQLTCQNAVQEPGDCCPRCVEANPCADPLLLNAGGRDSSRDTCVYMGTTYGHGDSWVLERDPCTSC